MLAAAGGYDLKDREMTAEVDAIAFAIPVRPEVLLIMETWKLAEIGLSELS
jgi:hypothetical protein